MRVLLAGAFLLAALATTAAAQQGVDVSGPHPLATRAQLEKQLAMLPADEKNGEVAKVIQNRLANGDFLPGDRIQLVVVGDTAFSKAFSVRPDTTIELPNIEPISLHGVLRSELDDYLDQKLRKYLTDPDVQARSLIRLAVVGEVARPGFYDLPPDAAASEVIVVAGGLTGAGDPQRTVVKRENKTLYTKYQVRQFYIDGSSLDEMGLRTGDQFNVGRRGSTNVLPIIAAVSGIAFAVAAFAGLFGGN
jgi:protein involved in polysaccharide export with SLBB domain